MDRRVVGVSDRSYDSLMRSERARVVALGLQDVVRDAEICVGRKLDLHGVRKVIELELAFRSPRT